jgi:hypothetical protein
MPETLGQISIGTCHYTFMSYIKRASLVELWPHFTPNLKAPVQPQEKHYVAVETGHLCDSYDLKCR